MNARTKRTAVRSGAAVIGTVFGLTAGLAPAAAAPTPSGATLFFCKDFVNTGNYRMTVRGVFPMAEADAVGYLVHINDNPALPGGMKYRMTGDDGGDGDDPRFYDYFPGGGETFDGYLKATPQGLAYMRVISIPRTQFDEDNNLLDDQDEVYAEATFKDADGGERTQYSQKVVGDFEVAGVCDGCCS
jgi:hypothetical protein